MDQSCTAASDVVAAIRACVPADIALAGGPIGTATSSPFAVENAAVERAVEKRRREFVAGRQYARRAMSQLGFDPAPLPVSPTRAPNWPQGVRGSISHAGDACVAIVAAASDFVGVGIDIERSTALSAELHATVCRPDELPPREPTVGDVDHAKMLFVVKEAFFKFYHPITGCFIDFLDASVRLDLARGTFVLELRDGPPAALGRRVFHGLCGHAGRYCFAFVALRA